MVQWLPRLDSGVLFYLASVWCYSWCSQGMETYGHREDPEQMRGCLLSLGLLLL